MSIVPIITFKAGQCELDASSKPHKAKPVAQPGYIYLFAEEDLIHFCWRARNVPINEPELDLVMVPTDGSFVPYDEQTSGQATAKTNGRIFVLKFGSSSQRHLFWLQSKPQGQSGDPAWLSPRDKKLGDIVNRLLQGDEVDVNRELSQVQSNTDDSRRDEDGDETMEDDEVPPPAAHGGSGGAGAGATGGDIREEGEDAREGGADGARAANSSNFDTAALVRNFLGSLTAGDSGTGAIAGSQQEAGKLYPLLSDLLDTSVTVPLVVSAEENYVDCLLDFLPPTIIVLAQQANNSDTIAAEPSPASVAAARAAMSLSDKKALLQKVVRSPQFHQSLASLTMALRDGGLPTISEALGIQLVNNGFIKGGQSIPLGGGEAVEAFVEGVKKSVQDRQ